MTLLMTLPSNRRSDNNSKLHPHATSMNTTTTSTISTPYHPAITPRVPGVSNNNASSRNYNFNATLSVDNIPVITTPSKAQVDMLISEANEITKCLHKNYVSSKIM